MGSRILLISVSTIQGLACYASNLHFDDSVDDETVPNAVRARDGVSFLQIHGARPASGFESEADANESGLELSITNFKSVSGFDFFFFGRFFTIFMQKSIDFVTFWLFFMI